MGPCLGNPLHASLPPQPARLGDAALAAAPW